MRDLWKRPLIDRVFERLIFSKNVIYDFTNLALLFFSPDKLEHRTR
jgi:hypothetical protein